MRVVAATPPRERNKVKLLALLVSSAGRGDSGDPGDYKLNN